MDSPNLKSVLQDALEEKIPPAQIELWPAVKRRLVASESISPKGELAMKPTIARKPVLGLAVLAALVLLILLLATPMGKAFAQNILRFFTRAGSDTLPAPTTAPMVWVDLTPGVPRPTLTPSPSPTRPAFFADCGDFPEPRCSMAQIRSKVDFTVKELGSIPAGMYFIGATGGPEGVGFIYDTVDHSGFVFIHAAPWTGSPEQTRWEVGASAAVESVDIGGKAGEYVKGTFGMKAGDADVVWDANADTQTMHWVDAGVFYVLQSAGRAVPVDREAFVALAESLTTRPVAAALTPMPATPTPETFDFSSEYPLTIAQAEEQAGFDVLEPSRMPAILLPLVGASYKPKYDIVRIFYPVDPGWVGPGLSDGLTLLEQLAPNPYDCALCGFRIGDSEAVWADDTGSIVGGGIQTVQIGDVPGQHVEGVWTGKNNNGIWAWESMPYFKRLRWQANGMAFELQYMGMEIDIADMIAIAESIH